MSALRVASVQLNSQDDVSANLAECSKLVRLAADSGASLVVLPENFAYFGPETTKRAIAERLGQDGPIQTTLRELALRTRVSIIAGGFPEASSAPERPFNTCVVIDRSGETVAVYRKIHLFDVDLQDGTRLMESEATSPGNAPVVVDVDGYRVGLSICYDLRFPELYRALVRAGAEVLVVPAAFTLHTGKDHWHVLLRARAIESQCWVVAAAQWGRHPRGQATYGHSLVCDPWGTVVAESSDKPSVVVATLDRDQLLDVRRRLPCLTHRRLRELDDDGPGGD
jgi:predicted amidohydrolase